MAKMRKLCSIFTLILVLQTVPLYSQITVDATGVVSAILESLLYIGNGTRLSPASKKELDKKNETVLKIESNVYNAEVYLNNVYQGRSNLTIKNLMPGQYKLELRKTNYETDVFFIEVFAGFEVTYSVSMREIHGVIFITDLPKDSFVYIDNNPCFSERNDVVMGSHSVKIERFGYKPFVTQVYVGPYMTERVTPVFVEAPFELSDFHISRREINPDYKNSLSKVEISFRVTAKETARFSVYAEDGSLVSTYNFPEFSNWKQNYSWNGVSLDGSKLDDGHYQIELECAGAVYKEDVYINRSLFYPVMNSTAAGLGYGKMPSLEPFRVQYGMFAINFIPVFIDGRFDCAQFDMALNGCFSKNFEGGIDFTCRSLPETGFGFNLTGDLKFSNSIPLGLYLDLSYGALVRYGYSKDPREMAGTDYGAGLGAGLMVGLSTNMFSVTGTLQYLAGCVTGNPAEGEHMFSGGISIGAKQSLTNSFFVYASYNNYNVLGFGAGANFMPFSTSIMLSASIDGNYYTIKNMINLNGKIGLSFIF